MHMFDDFGRSLPSCPASWHPHDGQISHLSTVILFSLFSFMSLLFSLIIAIRYNAVKVFNRKIRTQNISNTLWIIYFVLEGIRGIITGVRFTVVEETLKGFEIGMFLSSLVLYGITGFLLSLALNHQRRFRTTVSVNQGTTQGESEPLIAKYTWFRQSLIGSETIFFLLLIIYLVFLFLQTVEKDRKLFEILFLTAFGLQRLPIIILTLIIILYGRTTSNDGPTRKSKALLLIGATLNLVGDIPLTVWAEILPQGCPFYIGSWVDFIHFFYCVSLLFFFLFIRSEYLRNMEESIWQTVSAIQDTFDFRRFT